jgi:sRNA-binding regulator protein Hfq
MNRKLIRPNLSDVKGKESRELNQPLVREPQPQRPITNSNGSQMARRPAPASTQSSQSAVSDSGSSEGLSGGKNRRNLSAETNAEIYYYKKQIDSHTVMVIVLQDNEEIEGTIEWYDRHALKVNRKDAPNIMLLKHNIKYMYKAEDRVS